MGGEVMSVTLRDCVDLLTGTAEACGYPLSEAAAKIMASDLAGHDFESLRKACAKCRRELKHRLTLSDILERLQANDGRYTAEEAWAKLPKDESFGALITNEMEQAAEGVWGLLEMKDKFSAARAFKEAYERIVKNNRELGVTPQWRVSMGALGDNAQAIAEGLKRGVLSIEHLLRIMPPDDVNFGIQLSGIQTALPPPPTEKSKKLALEAKQQILKQIASMQMGGDS